MQINIEKPRNALTEVTLMKSVPVSGFVGAGATVVQFPLEKRQSVLVPIAKKNIKSYIVSGDSLEHPDNPLESVFDGDRIVVETINNLSELKHNSVCVVRVISQDLWLAKKVCVHGDQVALKSVNPKYDDVFYDIDDIEIIGIIVEKCQPYRR